jgi:type II secretory pathway component PulM
MKKFSNLSQREKILIIVLLFGFLPFVLYNFAIMPLVDNYHNSQEKLTTNQKTLTFIKKSAHLLNKTTNIDKNKPIIVRVDKTISKMRLPAPSKIKPIGKNTVKIEFNNIEYKQLMQFILKMQQEQAMGVKSITVVKTKIGMVNCHITLKSL